METNIEKEKEKERGSERALHNKPVFIVPSNDWDEKGREGTRRDEYNWRTCMIAVLKAVGLNKPLIHGHIGVSIAAVQSVNCLWLEEK